jgi:hypothetical protein
MKKPLSLLVTFLCFLTCNGQDTVLFSTKWQTFFREYDRSSLANHTSVEYNKMFLFGQYYDGLIIFKDTTRLSLPMMIVYPGFENLCDPRQKLQGMHHHVNQPYEIDKKNVKYFVFDNLIFAFDDLNRRKVKLAVPPNFWSLLILDGPIRITRHSYVSSYGGKITRVDGGNIYKDDDSIGSDLYSFGGFSFKKFGAKTFIDYPELANKIATEIPGYLKKDALKIIQEYNEWVKREDPEAYERSLLMRRYLK